MFSRKMAFTPFALPNFVATRYYTRRSPEFFGNALKAMLHEAIFLATCNATKKEKSTRYLCAKQKRISICVQKGNYNSALKCEKGLLYQSVTCFCYQGIPNGFLPSSFVKLNL